MSSVEVTIDRISQPAAVKAAEPCIIVIFGASGDLSRRKLVPALFDLVTDGLLTAGFEVLGLGRTQLDDTKFRDMLREGTERSKESHHFTPDRWNEFAQHLHYLAGPIDSPEFYPTLKAAIERLSANGDKPNVLFYLSLPPSAVPVKV